MLEVFECQHDYGNVVQGFVSNGCFHDLLNYISTNLMDWLLLGMEVLLCCDPRLLQDLGIADFIKDSVTYIKFSMNNMI